MSRYVDIDFILVETDEFAYENGALHSLSGNSAPSIDIVFCKECKYKDTELCAMYKLVVAGVRKYDDFCSYGESKE